MREIRLLWPELGLIGATRGMLGFGLGLLLSGKIPRDRRVVVGTTLAAVGLLSTIPLGIRVFRKQRAGAKNGHSRNAREPTDIPSRL
jgi:hypothetical protein